MRERKIFPFRTSFIALFLAVFAIGSTQYMSPIPQETADNEPTVVSTIPSDGEMDVERNIVIEITFSEELDSTARQNSTFTLMQGTVSVTGTLEYSGNKGYFTVTEGLEAETEYTANITIVSNYSGANLYDEQFNDEQTEEENYSSNGKKWIFITGGNSDPIESVDLGTAANFVILARTLIDNDYGSEVTGEKGIDPNFKSSRIDKKVSSLNSKDADKKTARVDSTLKKNDNRGNSAIKANLSSNDLNKAFEDMMTAYTNAAVISPVDFIDYKFIQSNDTLDFFWEEDQMNSMNSSEQGLEEEHNTQGEMDKNTHETSITLQPGVYKWNESVEISTNIILSGNAEAVWVFQIPESLTVNDGIEITLSNGAVAEHIFWQVAGEVNIGPSAHIEGIILSQKGITMEKSATINGRMLAQEDVTLDDNIIMEPKVLVSAQKTSSNK
jgi:hypothetical protein